ncbi:hypothetical protein OUZ56_003601 [Daphnia magna]|uniref:Uncharacterized protein n=2 Tax=Daphnia magna TaxID=35525 RepID=A0ABR0A972_9CRUS|nr:hypothetical protein OUZ56_003601 [Daphnia magna]
MPPVFSKSRHALRRQVSVYRKMFSTPLVSVEPRHRGDHRDIFLNIDVNVNQEIRDQGGFYFEELDTEMMVQQCQTVDFELEQSGNESLQINGEVDESLIAFEFKEDADLEFREDLAKTFLTCKTPHKHIEKILGVLRKNGHSKLPLTARTLLKTVRKASLQTSNMAYFGLEKIVPSR